MAESFLFDKLSILNNVYHQSLPSDCKQTVQSAMIKSKLYLHQQLLVEGMLAHRDRLTRGFLSDNQAINGKIGIIGDGPGTGKTLSVLAYIAMYSDAFPLLSCELTSNSSKYFYSHDLKSVSDQTTTNLIIVPHALFTQWRNEITKHTLLKYVAVETRRMLRGDNLAQTMIQSDFVITTNKCYKYVQEYAIEHQIHWNNVFVDEASSIHMNSSDPPLSFQFLWFITNNWIPLLFKNPTLSKNDLYHLRSRVVMHHDLEEWLLDNHIVHFESNLVSSGYWKDYVPFLHKKKYFLVLRNTNQTIRASMQLPNYQKESISCRPNVSIHSLSSYFLAKNTTPSFSQQKIPYVIQALNIECKSLENYVSLQPLHVQNLIRRKANENECMICMEKADYPMIVNCCYNIYCGRCLITNTILNKKCPTCREILGTNHICCLKELTKEDKMVSKTKMESCLDLLQNNRNGKFIIYSAFDNIYYQLFEEMDKLGIKAERIENNLFSMLRTITNFKEGRTNVLFVSNVDLIRGMSLSITSHLIFYHEPSSYEWQQILIHSAQRMGRSEPLSLIHLNSEIQV